MEQWKEYKLGEVAIPVRDRIDTSVLDASSYISTENMLPDKAGVTLSSDVPSGKAIQFKEGDILISNIRPYFKKIWRADKVGGCSADIICLRASKEVEPLFFYYLLSQDMFFNYVMQGAKGTKMPRGDRNQIMQWPILLPSKSEQQKIASILSALDEKIEVNRRINDNFFHAFIVVMLLWLLTSLENDNLEQQAQAIFEKIFPSIATGEDLIGNIITPKRGKGLLSKDAVEGSVPVVAGGLEPATYHNESNTIAPVVTISASGANAGYVNLWHIPVWSSDSSYIDSSMTPNVYFWYVMLKKRQKELFDAQTGSAQPHIYPKHVAEMPMGIFEQSDVAKFTEIVTPMFEIRGKNLKESERLASVRDSLLPKLMSGELYLDKVNV